jgi:hypothetical protein
MRKGLWTTTRTVWSEFAPVISSTPLGAVSHANEFIPICRRLIVISATRWSQPLTTTERALSDRRSAFMSE